MQQKVQNILTSAVTWLTVISVAASEIATELTDIQPGISRALASALAVVAIIRRVAPVPAGERGLS
jgi:hypothetical protein